MEKVINKIKVGVERDFTEQQIEEKKEQEESKENNQEKDKKNEKKETKEEKEERKKNMYSSNKIIIQKYIENDIPDNTLYVFSDSEYVINAITGKNKVNANKEKIEICKKLIREITEKGKKLEFIHVFAHTKGKDFISINNEIVDFAARNEATKMK